MSATFESIISKAIEGNISGSSLEIVAKLPPKIVRKMAAKWLDQQRGRPSNRPRYIDRQTQLALPGFQDLYAVYRKVDGSMAKLEDLTADDCLWNAARLRAEAAQSGRPRYRNEGADKLREAEQLERWAKQIKRKEA